MSFWASWCGPCIAELPILLDLYAQHHELGFEIVGVSLDTSERDLRSALSTHDVRWPVAFEGKSWDNSLAQLYRVYQIPTSYLLDRGGIIRFRDLHGHDLARRVVELLGPPRAEAPVETVPAVVPAIGPGRPILEIAVPREVVIAIGATSSFVVKLVNVSPYDAEEVTLTLGGLPPGVAAPDVKVGTVPAFGERTARIAVRVSEGPVSSGTIEVVYNYCIGDICVQIQDTAAVSFALGEAPPRSAAIPSWWLLIFIGVGLVLALFLRGRAVAVVGIVLGGLFAASLAVGALLGQPRQAQRIGAVLCMACVGIEEGRVGQQPALSREGQAILATLTRPVQVTVFSTEWCRSCPYAIALVRAMARVTNLLTVVVVDAEADPAQAERAGVARSGRLVVPATVVEGTGEVVFGVDNLEARLLPLLAAAGR
ncbi:TPA: hypothetical protein DCY67_05945 [Candidatus Acetothermia bacterium]|nr:hypothetical protein [Candidatus Acetothermia bacterium]